MAALNGYTRCIRILLADYIPSNFKIYKLKKRRSRIKEFEPEFNEGYASRNLDFWCSNICDFFWIWGVTKTETLFTETHSMR